MVILMMLKRIEIALLRAVFFIGVFYWCFLPAILVSRKHCIRSGDQIDQIEKLVNCYYMEVLMMTMMTMTMTMTMIKPVWFLCQELVVLPNHGWPVLSVKLSGWINDVGDNYDDFDDTTDGNNYKENNNLEMESPRFSNRLPANGGKWTLGKVFVTHLFFY